VSDHTEYQAPYGLAVRGTVLVVPGRGETQVSYHRFGTRLAADAYQVRVIDPPEFSSFAADLAGATKDVPRPLVLVGADSGAVAISAGLARADRAASWWPDGVVLAGIPGHAAAMTGDWETELDIRTACPVHRRVLTAGRQRGSLAAALDDELLDIALESKAAVPRLVLIGEADPLADREALARSAKAVPKARLVIVHAAHHDVLNDVQHRSVAAEVVSFLEALRNDLNPVLTVESSDW